MEPLVSLIQANKDLFSSTKTNDCAKAFSHLSLFPLFIIALILVNSFRRYLFLYQALNESCTCAFLFMSSPLYLIPKKHWFSQWMWKPIKIDYYQRDDKETVKQVFLVMYYHFHFNLYFVHTVAFSENILFKCIHLIYWIEYSNIICAKHFTCNFKSFHTCNNSAWLKNIILHSAHSHQSRAVA